MQTTDTQHRRSGRDSETLSSSPTTVLQPQTGIKDRLAFYADIGASAVSIMLYKGMGKEVVMPGGLPIVSVTDGEDDDIILSDMEDD